MSSTPKHGKWTQRYLALVRSGSRLRDACKAVGVSRQSATDWRQDHDDFVREERMARDSGDVERLIQMMDARGVPVE